MTDNELVEMAHTILLRMAMRGGFDSYTGVRLHKWLKEYESRPTPRALGGVELCAKCGQPAYHHEPSCFVHPKPPRQ